MPFELACTVGKYDRICTVLTLELVIIYSHNLQSMGILLNYCILFLSCIIIDFTVIKYVYFQRLAS